MLLLLLLVRAPSPLAWQYSPLQEKYALIDFQKTASTTSSSDWDKGWDHATKPCSGHWTGVRCSAAGYVTHVQLGAHHVNGRLFDGFYFFRDLEVISLGANDITHELPASIGSLRWLRTLDLSDNHLVGTIPLSWGSLTNLERLSLRGNPELSGTVPAALASLTHARFDLVGTQVSGLQHRSSGSSGNNGRAPYTASRTNHAASSTYPQQDRRVRSVAEAFHHSSL